MRRCCSSAKECEAKLSCFKRVLGSLTEKKLMGEGCPLYLLTCNEEKNGGKKREEKIKIKSNVNKKIKKRNVNKTTKNNTEHNIASVMGFN